MNLDEYKQEMASKSYKDLALELERLNIELDKARKLKNELQSQYDTITMDILPDRLAEDEFSNVPIKGVGRLQPSHQAYCSVVAGQKEALFGWLEDNGFNDLITEVVNASTLKSFVKECREEGRPVPPDEIVRYQPYTRVTLVKS